MARGSTKKANLKVVGGHTPPGHNSGASPEELSDEQQQVLFLQNLRKIKAAKDVMATASSVLRTAYKVAKSDGFTKKEIDFALDLEKDEKDEMTAARRRQAQIARWMSHPIGTQADLFDTGKKTDDRPLRDRAFDEGKRDGMLSEGPLKPPYDPGTDGYDGYVDGWHRGQEALAAGIKPTTQGAPLLRPEGNETLGPDAFDNAADEGGAPWPDEAEIRNRQPAEAL